MMTSATGHTWIAVKCRSGDACTSVRGLLGALHDMATVWVAAGRGHVINHADLINMSDEELQRRIMVWLKKSCDKTGRPYPYKLVAYLLTHDLTQKP